MSKELDDAIAYIDEKVVTINERFNFILEQIARLEAKIGVSEE